MLVILPVLPGGFSVPWIAQMKLLLLPEVGTQSEYVYVSDGGRKDQFLHEFIWTFRV